MLIYSTIKIFILDELLFPSTLKQHITDLTLINIDKVVERRNNYTVNVYVRILNMFENLKHLNIIRPSNEECPPLSFRGLPSTTFCSSILTKLCASLYHFGDCLYLLDGRLKQLTTFVVVIDGSDDHPSNISNSVSLIISYFNLSK